MGLFGGNKRPSNTETPATSLRVQSSIEGKPIPLYWGQVRLAGNLIWFGNFFAIQQKTSGGKGGGGGGKGGSVGGSYTYYASFIIGICEGTVGIADFVWENQTLSPIGTKGLGVTGGDYGMAPWPWAGAQALAYRGVAYGFTVNYPLGSSYAAPNLTFRIAGNTDSPLAGSQVYEATPSYVIGDFLTNPHYGIGFPIAYLGDMSTYHDYCLASWLLVSPVLTDQTEGRQFINDLLEATNSAAVWSSGVLRIVPYGDTEISSNGASYTPPAAPIYSLTDDDYNTAQGGNPNSAASSSSSDPVQCTRKRPSDQVNSVPVEFLHAGKDMNPAVTTATDDAAVVAYGLRRADNKSWHFFTHPQAAMTASHLALSREQKRNTFSFTLGQEYILLDPMDIVEITDSALGLHGQWVRILEITENQDSTLNISCEEYLTGTNAPPLLVMQASDAFSHDENSDPGGPAGVVYWEPTAGLETSLEVWIAVAGGPNWGGCDIWVSSDNDTYTWSGDIVGQSRLGVLAATLPTVPAAGVDNANVLTVTMTGSAQLASGSVNDMLLGNTLCYVDGEYIAYQNAVLVSGSTYHLSPLNRGMYGTAPREHGAGTNLVRVQEGAFLRLPYTSDRIGTGFYFKAQPFNIYGGGQPTLADCAAYSGIFSGLAMTLPPGDVENLTTFGAGTQASLSWDIVPDFRPLVYEIRYGPSWEGSQTLTRVAGPPYDVVLNGTYWVAAYAHPAPSIEVWSRNPASHDVSSSILTGYLVYWNENLTGWGGFFGGGATIVGSTVVANTPGTYEIPWDHQVDIGYTATCAIIVAWDATSGLTGGPDVLSIADWLSQADVLGASYYTVGSSLSLQIAISQDTITWSPWMSFAPGYYTGRKFSLRVVLTPVNGQPVIVTSFAFSVYPPPRIDHYTISVPVGGTTLAFAPDVSPSVPVPFLTGPGSATLPHVVGTIIDQQQGDAFVVSSLTATSCVVEVFNGGFFQDSNTVARTVNVTAQGY